MDPRLIDYTAIRKEIQASKRKRELGPDHVPIRDRVNVAYILHRPTGDWWILGFLRGRVTPKKIRRFRKKAKVAETELITFVELFAAHRNGGPSPVAIEHLVYIEDTDDPERVKEERRRQRRRERRLERKRRQREAVA